jgi:DNA mismatch endonuclease (patch repair protein)
MSDTLAPMERSRRMALIRSKDTKPEMRVRSLIHGLGYRYRLHDKTLPGTPDLVFPSKRRIIMIHGCFWHRHGSKSCRLARLPKSRLEFWESKLEQNRKRDLRTTQKLVSMGWSVLTLWECQLTDLQKLADRITSFLG